MAVVVVVAVQVVVLVLTSAHSHTSTIGDNQLRWQGDVKAAGGCQVPVSITHCDMIANYGAIKVSCSFNRSHNENYTESSVLEGSIINTHTQAQAQSINQFVVHYALHCQLSPTLCVFWWLKEERSNRAHTNAAESHTLFSNCHQSTERLGLSESQE